MSQFSGLRNHEKTQHAPESDRILCLLGGKPLQKISSESLSCIDNELHHRPQKRNVAAQVAGELKTVTHATPPKEGTHKNKQILKILYKHIIANISAIKNCTTKIHILTIQKTRATQKPILLTERVWRIKEQMNGTISEKDKIR